MKNTLESGFSFTKAFLISSSNRTPPWSGSTSNICPAPRLPTRITAAGSTSSTPTSLDSINKKIIKHTSTNSKNLTDVKIIIRISLFSEREIIKTKGVGMFSVNKAERTSRNHSKDKINKINNTTLKKNI